MKNNGAIESSHSTYFVVEKIVKIDDTIRNKFIRERISMKNYKKMNIAAALDRNYFRYTYVMLISLFENQVKDTEIHVYLLQSELIQKEKICLENLVKSYGGFLHWLQIDSSYFPKSCTEFARWPVESFYRLALPEILPEEMERILYLDVDIVINHSLRELYDTDFEGNAMCACPEPFHGMGVFPYRDALFKEHAKEGFIYFNSGVLLLNLKVLREKYGLHSYMEVAERYNYCLETPDQDLLNYVHWKDVKFVDTVKYNLYAKFAHNFGVGYEEAKSKVTMVHFMAKKPWNSKANHFEMERLWWDYAKKSPFYYDFREEYITASESMDKADNDLRLMTGEGIKRRIERKLKWSVPYTAKLWKNDNPQILYQKEFTETEIAFEELEVYQDWKEKTLCKYVPKLQGIILRGQDLDEEKLFCAVMAAEEAGASYIVINTENVFSSRLITDVLENCMELLMDKEIEIYLENGFTVSKQNSYQCSELSEIRNLKAIAQLFNRICEKECVGISIDVGNANLLSKNLCAIVEEAGNLLKLIHVNDNDRIHNDKQLPYTFTKGREDYTTDWHRFVEKLRQNHYQGRIVFNTSGFFEKAPEFLYPSYISLLAGIAGEWEAVLEISEKE